jgi:tetratricopeptide (TPR) repeat protein
LVEVGPDLVDTFLPGTALLGRARAYAPGEGGWLPPLEELVGRKAALPPDPNLQQSALFQQYTRTLGMLACQRPLLLLLDDLQWADMGSINLLFHLGRGLAGSCILIVGAYRPEEVATGRSGERHPLLPIVSEFKRDWGDVEVALGRAEDRSFIEAFLDTEPNRLSAAFRETLLHQTGGHPLFTVELLRGMQERGDLVQDGAGRWVEGPALDWETLPARVEAVIAERIGRLAAPSQDMLRVACVEGETFTAEVLAQVRADDRRDVVDRLSGELDRRHRLVRAQAIQRLGAGRLSHYRFRHILFQNYLYNHLDPVERAHLHEAVGTALEALYREGAERTAVIAPQLARHFQQAGIAGKAIGYLRQAGERAVQISANEEAITHLGQALGLLKTQPETPERSQTELTLQASLAVSLSSLKGWADADLGGVVARARELCGQLGETPQLFPVLWFAITFYSMRGEYQPALEIAEQLLTLAERTQDPVSLVVAHWMKGFIVRDLGELNQARVHLERAAALYDPSHHHFSAFLYSIDPGISALSQLSWTLLVLGYPNQALKRSKQALTLAQKQSHPMSLAFAQMLACFCSWRCGDTQTLSDLARACIDLSTEHGLSFLLACGFMAQGLALEAQGRVEEGVEWIHQGIANYRATGSREGDSAHLAWLAGAHLKIGQIERGRAVLAEASACVAQNKERWYEAEIRRLEGELLLAQSDEVGAEASYHKAIEVAQSQQAKSWELRATVSLCRLWQKQGKVSEARQVLGEIYGWFTEGFDTLDLQEAKTVLEELSRD